MIRWPRRVQRLLPCGEVVMALSPAPNLGEVSDEEKLLDSPAREQRGRTPLVIPESSESKNMLQKSARRRAFETVGNRRNLLSWKPSGKTGGARRADSKLISTLMESFNDEPHSVIKPRYRCRLTWCSLCQTERDRKGRKYRTIRIVPDRDSTRSRLAVWHVRVVNVPPPSHTIAPNQAYRLCIPS